MSIKSGITRVIKYADNCGAEGVYLVIFDPSDKPWDEKIFTEIRSKDRYQVEIFGTLNEYSSIFLVSGSKTMPISINCLLSERYFNNYPLVLISTKD